MLKDYTPGKYREITRFDLTFDDGNGNWFCFPCDSEGHLLQSEEENPCAYKNYLYCLKHPDRFVRHNRIVRHVTRGWDPGSGTCDCGNKVVLEDQYYGACQCSKCGKWYNLFGQHILPPDQWEEDLFGDDPCYEENPLGEY